MMPYLLRHYAPWVDKLIFLDGHSTDGTREMIQACPKAELRDYKGRDELADDEFQLVYNELWKEARGVADWVAWIDADEFLYHPDMRNLLATYQAAGITVVRTDGYTMVSDKPPTGDGQIYDEIKRGFLDDCWSKCAIFDPKINMTYHPGRHAIDIDFFTPILSPMDVKLLHYRALGMDYLRRRHARNWARVPQRCREANFGVNCSPGHDGHHSVDWFEKMLSREWLEVI